jgi:hypothetical protein
MHPNEIDLTRFNEKELEMFRKDIPVGHSEAHLSAFEEQLKRQTESKSK